MSHTTATAPKPIEAKQLRHPGRWIASALLLLIAVGVIYSVATNEAFSWDVYRSYVFDTRILTAAGRTILLTILAMIIGVVLGAIMAVLRMSPNPVMRSVSWLYLWIFRGTPVYVQLVFWGLLSTLYQTVNVGVAEIDVQTLLQNTFFLAVIGLGLNESAYMAEIARAGILSVDKGQREAAEALGMDSSKTMRRIVLPQAMRVIVPPTGNEAISMVKDTSLLVAVPVSAELFYQAQVVANNTYKIMPSYFAALLWYLIICSVLMLVQARLERKYGRGFGGAATDGGLMTKVKSLSFG